MPAFPGPLLQETRDVTAAIDQGFLADWLVSALIFAKPGTFLIATHRFLYPHDERQRRKKLETVRKHFRAGHKKKALC